MSSRVDAALLRVGASAEGMARAPARVAARAAPRILFFIPTLLVGGAERHTVDLCQRLRERGFPARILVHTDKRSPVMTAMPACSDAIVLGLKGMSDPVGWATIWRTLRRERPDIIVAVNQTPLIVSVVQRFAGATRAKLACIFHTTELQAHEKYQETLFRRLAPFADLLVYVGANQQRSWEARGIRPRRAALIRNGIDTARFAAGRAGRDRVRAQYGVRPDDLLLGILASFRIEKNHVELVAALARASDAGPQAKVLCIGQGDTRPTVEALARTLGVADRLIFAGEQSDVAPFLAACDAGVLCSTAETFPLSAIEFLAAGVPMISAEVGGATEIVQEGVNGLLYPPGDVDRLAAAIAAMSRPDLRAGLAARAQGSVAGFAVERMVDLYVEAFDALGRS